MNFESWLRGLWGMLLNFIQPPLWPGGNPYDLPNQDTVKKVVIGILPNNAGKVVYVITESGEIWKRVLP
jgi:hypothetical protein